MSHPSSSGEIAATSGLWHQYAISAGIIVSTLEKGDLEWIRVTDPEAKKVDDFQIATTARLDAYQVKWEQYPGSVTLHGLTQKDDPSLFRQLSDGWQALQKSYPDRRVVVHYVTNAYPSASSGGKMPAADDLPTPGHFSAFVAQAWKPARRDGKVDLEGPWAAVWSQIRKATGLGREAFCSFVADCELNLKSSAPEDQECKAVASLLFETAKDGERTVELSRTELLKRLGWEDRYQFRSRHDFKIPKFYQPISSTVERLERLIKDLPGGYIGVVGSPGSGKSTMLTRTLRRLPGRLVRYYAYVPDAYGNAVRGEAVNFLHDVTLRLEKIGVGRSGSRPKPEDRQDLLAKFQKQIHELGDEYAEHGKRTVVLVDGLDHIAREQDPERSLLADLPLPDDIPDGVFVVLGSQTTSLERLPASVQTEVEKEIRRVEMERLSPSDVESIAKEALPGLDPNRRYELFELSSGHPLALMYVVNRLRSAKSDEERHRVLEKAVPYKGVIDDYYRPHWNKVEQDDRLVYVLGLLSRVRGAINMHWASQWIERPTALKLQDAFEPYFDRDAANRWAFFHNSFRLFLQGKTARPVLGQSEQEQERVLHRDLAEKYEDAGVPWNWEALYHHLRAGDDAAALSLATTDWFREQIDELRPLDAVLADVKLAIGAAGAERNPIELFRLTLVCAEVEQQKFVMEDYPTEDRLLDLGDTRRTLEHIRDGNELRVGRAKALELSVRLKDEGMGKEGNRLFELAEPYELFGEKTLRHQTRFGNARQTLVEWVEAATRFRKPEEVLEVVKGLALTSESGPNSGEEEAARFRTYLGVRAAVASAEQEAWAEWKDYVAWVEETERGGLFDVLLDSTRAVREANPEHARDLLQSLLKKFPPLPLEDKVKRRTVARLDVAELAISLLDDLEAAREWLEDVPPPVSEGAVLEDKILTLHKTRLRYYRLRCFLGMAGSPNEIADEIVEHEDQPNYSTDADENEALRKSQALIVGTLAALWGRGKRGDQLPAKAFIREVQWLLDTVGDTSDLPRRSRRKFRVISGPVVEAIVRVSHQHGREAVQAVADYVKDAGKRWPAFLQRSVAIELRQAGAEKSAYDLLMRSSSEEHEGSPRDRAEEYWEQTEAWLEVGDREKASEGLRRMIRGARGLPYENDHQSRVWVRWMKRANAADPENAEERIRVMLRRLVAVSGDASGVDDAAEELVEATFYWSPRQAVALMKGVQKAGVLSHDRSLSAVLRGALEAPNPPLNGVLHIVACLLIPLANPLSRGVVEALIKRTAEEVSKKAALQMARYLAERTRTEALRKDRNTWFNRLSDGLRALNAGPQQANITHKEAEEAEQSRSGSGSDNKLHLNNGSELSLGEAMERVESADDFLALARERNEGASFFSWHEVAEKGVEVVCTAEEAAAVAEAIEKGEVKVANLLAKLSGRVQEMGEQEEAEALAERALRHSEPAGWSRRHDGGSRLEAFKALQKFRPDVAQERAIETYAKDLNTGQFVAAQRIVLNAEDILPLLFEEIPVLEVWKVISEYLERLYGAVNVEPVAEIEKAMGELAQEGIEDTATRAVADAASAYLDHPSYVVGAYATKAVANSLVAEDEIDEVEDAVADAAERSNQAAGRVMAALEAARQEGAPPDLGEEMLHGLLASPNLAVRANAARLASKTAAPYFQVPRISRVLPGIYELELPELTLRTDEVIERGEASKIVGDLAEKLRPFDMEAKAVADLAGLNEDVVIYRAVQLLEDFGRGHSWIEEGKHESDRLRFLRAANIRTAFRKPHVEPSERAIAYIAAELWDAGHLSEEAAQRVLSLLYRRDPSLVTTEPVPRPSWMPALEGIDEQESSFGSVPQDWLAGSEESLGRIQARDQSGRFLLAEKTEFVYLGTNTHVEEVRSSHIVASRADLLWEEGDLKEGKLPLWKTPDVPRSGYPGLAAPEEHLVVSSNAIRGETPAAGWVAFNPRIARQLGWRNSEEGLFRWVSREGDTMVKSVWWRDGNPERHDSNQRHSIGQGWYVVATETAMEAIQDQLSGGLHRGGFVRRSMGPFASGGMECARSELPSGQT